MTVDVVHDLSRVIEALTPEQNQTLDHWSELIQGWLNAIVTQGGPPARRAKNLLNGVGLGHPLHPALTDATVGAWSTGMLLDLVGATREADAALTVGVLAALPTALAGAADWQETSDEPRRMGLLHALLNSGGLTLMIASLVARRSRQRALGIALSTTGLTLTTIAAWLGGEMVYRKGMGVSRIAFEPTIEDFQVVAPADSLEPGKLTSAEATVDGQKVALTLLKRGRSILAISGTCPHWGGPLAEGKLLEGDVVECPWHASQFRMQDGCAVQGPASMPVHVYETRVRNGNVEVRSQRA